MKNSLLFLLRANCRYRVVAPDLRGHGETTTSDDGDLSAATLAADVGALWQHLFRGPGADRVPTVLVGHSMGGAVAVWAAAGGQVESLDGLVVIDVVEGTALGESSPLLCFLPPFSLSLLPRLIFCLHAASFIYP